MQHPLGKQGRSMAAYIDGRSKDQRKQRDGLTRMLLWLGVLGWTLMFVAFIIIDKARPDDARLSIDKRLYEQTGIEYNLRTTWDTSLTDYILYLMIGSFALSIIGLAVNAMRHKRRGDRYYIHLVLLLLAALSGIGWYGLFLM